MEEKLRILSQEARWDCEIIGKNQAVPHQHIHSDLLPYVTLVSAGCRKIPLLKVLLTNLCIKDCKYCGISSKVTGKVVSFKPMELARAFYQMQRRGVVKGLFLSSGIIRNADYTMELLNYTARLLRGRFGYRGYIHLKVMPGASVEAVDQARRYADRVSVNLEAPTRARLARIAPGKDIKRDMLPLIERMSRHYRDGSFPAGFITQFVVGSCEETDFELLKSADYLYRGYGLRRAYYSGFEPLKGTPMQDMPATPNLRQNRLYQADFLIRSYGFRLRELVFDRAGNLLLDVDPKLAWAIAPENQRFFPVEINRAPYEVLLRVPGIGPRGAARILNARRETKIRLVSQLVRLGIPGRRSAPFILLDGRSPFDWSREPLFMRSKV
jgi:predicted DNA-binding helix-hairpin-helix protein